MAHILYRLQLYGLAPLYNFCSKAVVHAHCFTFISMSGYVIVSSCCLLALEAFHLA